VRIWIIKHKPNKDPKFHKELILDGEGSSTKEPLTIFNKGWTFKIEVIINWGQFGLQDANSPIIEELIFLHDFINLILIFIISFVRYIIISILLNNYIFKRDKQESSSGSGTGSSSSSSGSGSSGSIDTRPDVLYPTLCYGITYKLLGLNLKKFEKSQENTKKE